MRPRSPGRPRKGRPSKLDVERRLEDLDGPRRCALDNLDAGPLFDDLDVDAAVTAQLRDILDR
jgi:hypothetical protein